MSTATQTKWRETSPVELDPETPLTLDVLGVEEFPEGDAESEEATEGQVSILDVIAQETSAPPARPERKGAVKPDAGKTGPVSEVPVTPRRKQGTQGNPKNMETTQNTAAKDVVGSKRGTQSKSPASPFTILNPHDPEALKAYAAKCGCTKNGAERFAEGVASESFRSREIRVIDLTPHLTKHDYLPVLRGAVLHMDNLTPTNQNPKTRAGFTFDAKAPQKGFYVSGNIDSQLPELNSRGWAQGIVRAHYLVLPETVPGVKAKVDQAGMLGQSLPPYNPIVRLLSHVIEDDGLREAWFNNNIRGAAFVPQDAQLARHIRASLPRYVFQILQDELGLTDEELDVTTTTYAQMAQRAASRRANNGRRRGIVTPQAAANAPRAGAGDDSLSDAVAAFSGA